MKWFGERGKAFFDAWTVIHLAFWLVVGAVFVMAGVAGKWWVWPVVFAGAYIWEVAETLFEHFVPERVLTWEGKVNRWISDPLMAVIGVGAAIWLLLHM